MQQAISWMTFFNFSNVIPISLMHYCVIFFFFSIHPVSLWFQHHWQKESLSALSLIHIGLTSLSFNVNIAQTGFPIPPLKRNTLKDLEQEVLSYDKLYLNLRGKNLVPDCSDTGGLWLLSQNLKNVIPHSVAAALGPHFHFAQCRQMEEFSGCAKRKNREKR